ncbi:MULTISPECIES: conjugative transfer protein MobI(A/C) [unclassified Rhodanobacter]|uniref:conjugative transfer protein MobI(A/C) n=1 Tax=unclassified Rhodanobacter TaxID=2621553 RepID=UPI0007A9EB1D|nr:conjugative transfer protein MobI(A/C) [Rhodanobacter sp. FW510-R10]KZC32646.1 hypothetical protein RhoFW510R10_12085 [Rhodanobacter sp. FW510-R10]
MNGNTPQNTSLLTLSPAEATQGLEELRAIAAHLQLAEALVEAEATALMTAFREARSELRNQVAIPNQGEVADGKAGKYSPLNLGVRAHKGGLEIYWFTQNKSSTGRTAYRYIPLARGGKGAGYGYHMSGLLTHARPYERELVRETERRAAAVRAKRAALVDLRRASLRLVKQYEEQLASDQAAVTEPGSIDAQSFGAGPLPGYT